jgi:hypothetical protein
MSALINEARSIGHAGARRLRSGHGEQDCAATLIGGACGPCARKPWP